MEKNKIERALKMLDARVVDIYTSPPPEGAVITEEDVKRNEIEQKEN